MKSIGETLREAREQKGATVKQISQDINISREYLTALEEETFDIFPAETYLLGFLRNYSEYLGLDVEKSIALYKNYKISEEPAPLEELVGQSRGPSTVPVRLIVIILVLALLGAGGWFGAQYLMQDRPETEEAAPARVGVEYRLDESEAAWKLLTGDKILISYEGGEMQMAVTLEDSKLLIHPVGGGQELSLLAGDEKILPGGDGIPVVGFRLNSIDDSGALLAATRTDVTVAQAAEVSQEILPALPIMEGEETILLAGRDEPGDFTLNAQFSGYCLFRYQVDNGDIVEKYYRSGERIRQDATESLMIGYSSGGAVAMRVSGVNVTSGAAGEVAVKLIQWVKNDEGKFDLVLFPVQ